MFSLFLIILIALILHVRSFFKWFFAFVVREIDQPLGPDQIDKPEAIGSYIRLEASSSHMLAMEISETGCKTSGIPVLLFQ